MNTSHISNILSGLFFLITFVACNSLDLPPLNVIKDDDVFQDEAGINSYMARLYGEAPIEDLRFNINGFNGNPHPFLGNWAGETLQNAGGYNASPSGTGVQWWGYSSVRNVNYFIEVFPQYRNKFSAVMADIYMGEAYFIRAYYYFAMVKRYGGVPIIDKLQNFPQESLEELKVPRDKEQAVYDFIARDLDEAIRLLPEASVQTGRANRGIAYALKSKAMLYAASIAQYGTIQLDGILGIPKSEATKYYQSSYDASLEVGKRYSLYNKHADKFENYWNLFLDKDNPEAIFVKYFLYPSIAHSFDAYNIPFQMRGPIGWGSIMNPTLNIVELFDDIEGNPGTFKVEENGTPIRFDNVMDLFKKIQPRLRASVILPGDVFKGDVIDVQKGLYTSYPEGELRTSADWNEMYTGANGSKHITGKSGIGNSESTTTGFHARKYMNPATPQGLVLIGQSEQAYIDIRYGEILLNRAEAAFALGNKDDALEVINQIRDRAGAKLYQLTDITEQTIRKERRMELAFENQGFWDLRRWRTAADEINNVTYTALCPYYIYDEDKYIFRKEPVGISYTFDPKVYYQMIPTSEIDKNSLLIQNPGY
ncbi:MAG: RagB/SusD family nutrient uptake outer membrane protein [Tannerellaceae bacterium]|nr:RagB/SusD family nutrient uptake outer membrane protein [Tannerellaceae bacterium]